MWLEAELPGARALFSTRKGGISEGAFASLNLGLLTDDDAASVHENRARFTAAAGIEAGDVLSGRQVHGAQVLIHERQSEPLPWIEGPGGAPADVDGHATPTPGLAPLVFVADCLPVALAGPGGVAMLHCGWRGLAGGIVARGAATVAAEAAAIGPGIGPCCYEVGSEVLAEFEHLEPNHTNGRMLDLPAVAEALLRDAGVSAIERAALCTFCESELFFSHRRDAGRTGRQAGMVFACPS
jgi:YfiH family protein